MRHTVVACVLLFSLTACSGTFSTQPSTELGSALQLSARGTSFSLRNVIFVADDIENAVLIYPTGVNNPAPIGRLTIGIDHPEGLWVDRDQTLYVANEANGTVTEFPPSSSYPRRTLSYYLDAPQDVTTDSSNDVFVANNGSRTGPGYGELVEYPNFNTTPMRIIRIGSGSVFAGGVAVNSSGVAFVDYFQYPGGSGHVFQVGPRSYTGTDTGIRFPDGQLPSLAIDGNSDLYAGNGDEIAVFPPSAVVPTKIIKVSGGGARHFARRADGTLFVAVSGTTPFVQIFGPNGMQAGRITSGLKSPQGVALGTRLLP